VKFFAPTAIFLAATAVSLAQPSRTLLTGHIHPLARPENDRGRVSPALQLSYVTLMLAQSASQQASLDQLLSEQQTPGSPNYHRWITPEEYGQRFGASQADVDRLTTWLRGQGLDIAAVARGRNWIAVNGAAAQVESAFQTEIHEYVSNGETHFANATEPSVPVALAGIVKNIRGLHDFRPKPAKRTLTPAYTSRGAHYLAPNDFATIYDVTPLYASGINGTGQSLAVAGQTQINLSDITTFRSSYNLPTSPPQLVLVAGSKDPGISSDDLPEADLDVEWAGAVARNATIIYVYSTDVMVSVQYIIDQNLAPVVTSSYGSCELETLGSEAASLRSFAKQGNTEGITWVSSAGDSGGADCDDSQNPGLSVDVPASIPEVTGMGGTEFSEGTGTYWNTANDANQASARSYIPEMVWNDSASDGMPAAGGGGVSIIFAKPSWQTGPGVPSNNARNVPDISLSASADHDGYLVYTGGSLQIYGGTSVASPTFAGITALLNQYLVSTGAPAPGGVGNMNAGLYALAQSAPTAFHDVTAGNNIVTVACSTRTKNCTSSPVGYTAGVGYDNASGLGSVDAFNLVTKWNGGSVIAPPTSALTLLSNLTTLASNDVIFLTATATGANGVTPAGVVVFEVGNASLGSATLVGSAGVATATLAVSGSQLSLGSVTITASYTESSSASATASITLGITPAASAGAPSIGGLTNGASFAQTYAPGAILSVFGSDLALLTGSASSLPLPLTIEGVAATVNGEAAPLYYVSSGQLNIQIPYETAVGSTATLKINNNGQVTTQTFPVASAAPGVFVQNGIVVTGATPEGTAARGQITTLYMTGGGAVTPAVPTGAAPSASTPTNDLPQPSQTTTITVGGLPAPIQFIGDPSWGAGVTQINFQVPTGVGIGPQPVVVKVGSAFSPSVTLNVTN
jgi:uncharacterized protein (TIGR03437 family)